MKNFKIVAFLLVLLLVVLELFVFNNDTKKEKTKPLVAVSTFALQDITKHIAEDSVSVVKMLPVGVDPHSFELTPKLMAKIEKSSLVLYSGAGLEPWIDKITFKAKTLDMSKYVKLRELGANEFECHKHHDAQCVHNRLDPHYWLDFTNMQKMTYVITEELIKLLPANRAIYLSNRDKYITMLQRLDASYTKTLASCSVNDVVLNHNSLGYLARNYNFHSESLSGLSPEADPTPSDIKRVFKEIKKDGMSTIFYESFMSDKLIRSIAKDMHVNVDVIRPLGNITADEARANATYESLMKENLQKLSKAMFCR